MWGLLISSKWSLRVLLFQEKPDGDQCAEPKTEPGSAGAKLPLQGDGDPGSRPGVSSTQLPAKPDQLDPTSAAASAPPPVRSPLGPREQIHIRRPPSPIASLMDRYADAGSRTSTQLSSTDLLNPNRFYKK